MIINLRGTSGAGKSHIVREVMLRYNSRVSSFIEGRRQPIQYRLESEVPSIAPLIVLGHYESPCGGCDTIHSLDQIFELAKKASSTGANVLFEGVMMYSEVTRTVAFDKQLKSEGKKLSVVCLDTPLSVCLKGIQDRRSARGNFQTVNPKNTKAKWDRMKVVSGKLRAFGVETHWKTREDALAYVLSSFGW